MENDHVSAIDIEEDATNEVVPASQIKVSAGPDPESTFEEYPYLHLPIFQKVAIGLGGLFTTGRKV